MKNITYIMLVPILIVILNVQPVHANKDALARAQYMIRQINAELNQLKSFNEKLKIESKESDEKYSLLESKYKNLSSKSSKNKKSLSGKIAGYREKLRQEVAAHNITKNLLSTEVQTKNRLLALSDMQKEKIKLCIANNNKLYDVTRDMLVRYENKGVWDSLTQAEPVSGLTQVEIENIVDDYQYVINDLYMN